MHTVFLALLDGDEPVKIAGGGITNGPSDHRVYRCAVRRCSHARLAGCALRAGGGSQASDVELNRVQGGQIYWVDEDRIVPFDRGQLHDAGDAAVLPHDLMATLAAARAKTAEETRNGRVPAVVGGDDSILFPAVAGFHDAVAGTVAIVHFDAHLDLM